MAPVLSTSRYVKPGVYIGELIQPTSPVLPGVYRIPNYIGKGSRYMQAFDQPVRRAFVYREALTFTSVTPFQATLAFPSDGNQADYVQIYDANNVQVNPAKWMFVKDQSNIYSKVQILDEVFDKTATYYVDYQSTSRNPVDPFPVADVRKIISTGLVPGENTYSEFTDYYIETAIGNPARSVASVSNPVISLVTKTGTGLATMTTSGTYSHAYNRHYELQVTAIGGTAGTYTGTVFWRSIPVSGGNTMAARNPVNAGLDTNATLGNQFSYTQATNALTFALEYGISVTIVLTAGQAVVNDLFEFDAIAPANIEVDSRFSNTNQFISYGAFTQTGGGSGTVAWGSTNNYLLSENIGIKFVVGVTGGLAGSNNRTATLYWSSLSGNLFYSGSISLAEATPTSLVNVSLFQGLTVTFGWGATNFVVGDTYSVTVLAPRMIYKAKDPRNYTITIGTATALADTGSVTGSYLTDTPEGSGGSIGTVQFNGGATFGGTNEGRLVLPDNIELLFRNMAVSADTAAGAYGPHNQFQANFVFTFATTVPASIDWTLNVQLSEAFTVASLLRDINGAITGTPGTWYIELKKRPVDSTVVSVLDTNNQPVTFAYVLNTNFVYFVTKPVTTITVNYQARGNEPDPGQLYYVTCWSKRPATYFNKPTTVYSLEDGKKLLGPAAPDNHLYIMNQLAWAQNPTAVSFTQVANADGSGIYSNTDYDNAINATRGYDWITDRVVLSHYANWGTQLSTNVAANDPFAGRVSMDLFGTPIGTAIGDRNTVDTLLYLAAKTLQVSGSSQSHGTRVLVSPRTCKVSIQMSDGTTAQLTLDGSFVAGAITALFGGFADFSQTILRQNLFGFDYIETYDEATNMIFGDSQILYFSDLGAGVYRIEEDTTVDRIGDEFKIISAMLQKQNVTRKMKAALDTSLIGLVYPSKSAARESIRGAISSILISLLARGEIAPYQDENGNERPFNPGSDVVVLDDKNDKTLFNFYYNFFLKYPTKRVLGLYKVDQATLGF